MQAKIYALKGASTTAEPRLLFKPGYGHLSGFRPSFRRKRRGALWTGGKPESNNDFQPFTLGPKCHILRVSPVLAVPATDSVRCHTACSQSKEEMFFTILGGILP